MADLYISYIGGLMRLKIESWERKAEEVRKKTELLYEEILQNQRAYYQLQQSITKGELLWMIVNGTDTGNDYRKKENVCKQVDSIKTAEAMISNFQEKYLKAEDMQLYMKGIVTADMNSLRKSYELGNMDAAFIWGLVTLQNKEDNQYNEALEALKKVANGNTYHVIDAKVVLAQYYENHGLTESMNIKETENELNSALQYYDELKKQDPDRLSDYEDKIKIIKSTLKCYSSKTHTENKVKFKSRTAKIKDNVARVLATIILSAFAMVLVEVALASVKHGLFFSYSNDLEQMQLKADKADTVVLDKYSISFSKDNPFFHGDVIPIVPTSMNVFVAENDYKKNVVDNYIVNNGVTEVINIGRNDRVKTVELPDTVVEIKKEAFKDWTALETIKLSKNLTKIGNNAFEGTGLIKVTIPKNVTAIGDSAFYGCSNLKKISLSKNITYIGEDAFYDCTSLKSITLPYGIETISKNNFYDTKTIYVDKREYKKYKNYFNSNAKVLVNKN
jgi:hypothetical protein